MPFRAKLKKERPRLGERSNPYRIGEIMAEGVGFEPTVAFTTSVFKTGAFDHSATPPRWKEHFLTLTVWQEKMRSFSQKR